MEKRKPVVPTAKWGAACAECSKSKARCLRTNQTPGAKCDRCNALKRDCAEQVHKPRKKRTAKPDSQKETTIEKRLDSLIHLLQRPNADLPASTTPRISPANSSNYAPPLESPLPAATADDAENNTSQQAPRSHRFLTSFNAATPTTCVCHPSHQREAYGPLESDEALLNVYINHLTPWFPFVIIQPGTTVQQLRETRPYLWKAIRTVASLSSLRAMFSQGFDLVEAFSEALIIRSERSVDLLQGLLVLAGWFQYFCLVHAQFNSLVQLAVVMSADLGLTRNHPFQEYSRNSVNSAENPKFKMNEERRLILGVWFMNSHASMTLNRLEPMRYTKHMDQCLNDLRDAAEYESDQLLVELIRIQHLSDRVYQVNSRRDLVDELPGIPVTPVAVYRQAFITELDRLRSSLPENLRSNYLIVCNYDHATLRIHETLLLDEATSSEQLDVDAIYRTHAAIKTAFHHMTAIPVCYYFYFPQPVSAMVLYGIAMLCRWVKLESTRTPALAEILARPELQLDAPSLLEQLQLRIESARKEMKAAHGRWDNTKWDLAGAKLRLARVRLKKLSEIVDAVGGEALLLRKYSGPDDGTSLRSMIGSDEDGGRIKEPAEINNNSILPNTDGPSWSNIQGDYDWAGDMLDRMEIDPKFFFDFSGDWAAPQEFGL